MRQRLSGRIHVALPADQAFKLCTPCGEREWAPSWDPRFPTSSTDDSEPGTVFETDAHGQPGTWLVTERVRGKRIAYAQVIPGERAGRITVTLADGRYFVALNAKVPPFASSSISTVTE